MKNIACAVILSLAVASPVFAAGLSNASAAKAISANAEVQSLVSAFEKNRFEKCESLKESNVTVDSLKQTATGIIACNQYDADGEPMANVYNITVSGSTSGGSFELDTVKIAGAE